MVSLPHSATTACFVLLLLLPYPVGGKGVIDKGVLQSPLTAVACFTTAVDAGDAAAAAAAAGCR